MRSLLATALLLSTSVSVLAGPPADVPEPEMFAILAIGIAGLLVARRRNK